MTVNDLWQEVIRTIDEKSSPNNLAGMHLRKLLGDADGQERFRRGVKESLKKKKLPLLRLFARMIDPNEQQSVQLNNDARRALLEDSVDVAAAYAERDATYWRLRWLQLASGQTQIATKLSLDFRKFFVGCINPRDMANRFRALTGWGDLPRERWAELLEKANDSEPSSEFRSHLQKVIEDLKSGGGQPPAKPPASPTPPPATSVAGQPVRNGPRAPEPTQAKTATSRPTTSTAAEGDWPKVPGPTAGLQPAHDAPPQSGESPVPKASAEVEPSSELQQTADQPAAQSVPPQSGGGIAAPAGETVEVALAVAKQEDSKDNEALPTKKTSTKKPARKKDEVATSQAEPATGNSVEISGGSEPVKPSASEKPNHGTRGELPAVLTELASAVRAISGRLDQIASRAGDWASLEQRLVELERRLGGVERAVTDTPSDAHRSQDEVERLRARVREREQDLEVAIRERDAAVTRADDLARRLGSADARIAAAESRADQNIHEAFLERDTAVLTFKAELWEAVQAQLTDVTEPTPGEEFASVEEQVLMVRLRIFRDALRAVGIPP